jgi:hypothetical protein
MKIKKDYNVIMQEYYDIYFEDTTKARLLLKSLNYQNDPFILSEIAHSYFDENKLRLAERYSLKAFSIDSLNSNVLWILGLVKWDYGQIENAIFCFKEIIRIGIRRARKSSDSKTLDASLARINDSKLQLYRLLKDSNPPVAKRYLKDYERGLKKGIFTIMDSYYKQIKADYPR